METHRFSVPADGDQDDLITWEGWTPRHGSLTLTRQLGLRWARQQTLAGAVAMALVPDAADDEAPEPAPGTLLPPSLQLFVLSFLMLFVELALIRWSGALVICFSYFSNLVLLGSFLGIGIGFLRARSRVNLFPCAPVALAR